MGVAFKAGLGGEADGRGHVARQYEVTVLGVAGVDGTVGEEIEHVGAAHLPQVVGITQHERLALPVEPQILIQALGVDHVVQLDELTGGVLVLVHVQHAGDLRGLHTVGAGLGPHLAEGEDGLDVVFGAVGVVEEDHVHPRVGQQLGLLAEDVAVNAVVVVAVDGLVPEADGGIPPGGVLVVLHRLGVLLHQLCHIDQLVPGVAGVPGVVEDAHVLVLADTACLLVGGQIAVKAVGAHPHGGVV